MMVAFTKSLFILLLAQLILGISSVTATACSDPTDQSCPNTVKIRDLFAKDDKEIIEFLGGIYEHSSWVAETLVSQNKGGGSITTVSGLADAMKAIVDSASHDAKLELLQAHPDLAQKVEALSDLTEESQEEQSSAGLQSMTPAELETFTLLNTVYKQKYQFPFILAVRHSTKFTVLSALEGRISNPPEVEFVTALQQVHKIAWMRLLAKVESDDPKGFLTCHVLDTANGIPAAKMRISLTRLSPEPAGLIANFVTNDDGRLEGGPALKGSNFTVGTYEWVFYAGDYFASQGTYLSGTPFVDEIPLRFGIDNPDDHYHVPLLVSPWSYSTYRGS